MTSTASGRLLSKNISSYKINIEIKSAQIKENIIEVLTSLSLTPTKDESEKIEDRFDVKISGIFKIVRVEK